MADRTCISLATGPWTAAQVRVRWLAEAWIPPERQRVEIDRAWRTMSARPGVRIFDGPMARLAGFTAVDGTLALELQPTSYRPFLGTNGTSPGAGDDDALANPLGTSAMVRTGDGWLLLGRRSAGVALHPGLVHPFGGCHEPADGDDVFAAIARELDEELGLRRAELDGLTALELVREPDLRQPELLFAATTPLDAAAVAARLDPDEHAGLWRMPEAQAAVALSDPGLTPVARAMLAAWLRHRSQLQAGPT